VHLIEFRLTQSTKQVVNRLVVSVEHVPRSWSKEVHRLDIACVHCDIPKDLTLSAEEHCHPLTTHLVVFAIEVWRTRTPFLVRHPWILDWLESIKTRNLTLIPIEGLIWRTREGGSEWEPIKILLEGDGDSNKTNTASNTCLQLTTQVGQAHATTGVLPDLGTNKQPSEPKLTNMHSGNLHGLLPVLHRSDRWPAPVSPRTPVRPVDKAGQASGYSSRTTSVPESLSDFFRPWNKNTPNRPRTDQQHHDPKTHESSRHPRQIPQVAYTSQTGHPHRLDRSSLGSSG
jgi:hypothetical protein